MNVYEYVSCNVNFQDPIYITEGLQDNVYEMKNIDVRCRDRQKQLCKCNFQEVM